MTLSRLDHVLDALVEQAAVHYAVVTSPDGSTVAEAGDLPPSAAGGAPGATVDGGGGAVEARVVTMVEVGEGKILHMGTVREFPEPELRQLRSVVASAV